MSEPTFYTVPDLAKLLKIGRNSAYNLVKTKQFVTLRIGRRIVIPRDNVERWLREGPIAAAIN